MLNLVTGPQSIPLGYRNAEPDFELAARLLDGSDLHIVGGVGSGKSTLACAILKGVVELSPHLSIGYINAYELEGIRLGDREYQKQMEGLFDVDALVIDGVDIGLCRMEGYENLYRLLNRRYPVSHHTITTSFFDGDDLALYVARWCGAGLAWAIANRIRQLSEKVRLHSPDRRVIG